MNLRESFIQDFEHTCKDTEDYEPILDGVGRFVKVLNANPTLRQSYVLALKETLNYEPDMSDIIRQFMSYTEGK